MCCNKFADNQQSSWKIILAHYLKDVGAELILRCTFDLKKLPINLPNYHEECFRCFEEYSIVASMITEQALCQEIQNAVIRNNKFVCIQGTSVLL